MLGLLLFAAGCVGARKPPYRPTIDQLVEEAIVDSTERRLKEMSRCDPCFDSGVVLISDSEPREEIPTPVATADRVADAEEAVVLSEEFFETDVREAISILAEEADEDVIVGDKVRGVVNARIDDLTFDEALTKILLPLGFVSGKRGDQYLVCHPDPDSPLFPYVSDQVEYRPKHVLAKDLLAAPPKQMLPYLRLVESSDSLIIEAPEQHLGMILERLERLDRPIPQVELEAIVCVVSPDSGFRFGLDWQHAVEMDEQMAFRLGASGLALSGAVSPAGVSNLFDDFATTSAFVKLLAENGYLSIRASPRVMAQDGKQANITIGRETFFAIQPIGATGDNNTLLLQQDIQKVEAGITLDITPHIRGDVVTVQIDKAEVSEDIRTASAELALNPYPIINRRSVSTTVNVQDGKTIIIGGLVQRQVVDRQNRVTGLSKLPVVGHAFRSEERQHREAEIVIFISPRIVEPPACLTACGLTSTTLN